MIWFKDFIGLHQYFSINKIHWVQTNINKKAFMIQSPDSEFENENDSQEEVIEVQENII